MSDRLIETEHQEPRRRARSGGSRATSATTGSSEDGSSGQHADYDTEVNIFFKVQLLCVCVYIYIYIYIYYILYIIYTYIHTYQ
jgi:hypothetical protein